ncbi:prostatic acid phosphatase [Mixophyes fleayi]|uniref:prostatic acid phosphatase n=1 Tax=Mixophyes fleayi TaxID=3061075 RepID=UPI003F4DE80D
MSAAHMNVRGSTGFFLSGFFFLYICLLLFCKTTAEKKLKFVVLVFRHGDRSPIKTYPNDKYKEDIWPDGFEQLTQRGMEQQFELGTYLRKRYSEFLNQTYSRHEVYVKSTDMDRTILSAQTNLAGLFPSVAGEHLNSNITWQPVPVHTVPLTEDNILMLPLKNCPLYNQLQKETYTSKEFYDLVEPYKDVLKILQNHTGYSPEQLNETFTSWIIYDALSCERYHNYSLPEWVTKDVMDKLSHLSDISMSSFFGIHKHYEKSRLQGGVLLSTILKNITNATMTPSGKLKLIMYSAHDTTIAALQMALNVSNGKIPPYAACHFFELYQDNESHYSIEMFYRNDSSLDPYPITLPGCSSSCPLAQFTDLTSSIIVQDWDKECGAKVEGNKSSGAVIGLSVAVVLLIIVIIGLLRILCNYRKHLGISNYETV